MRSLSRHVLIVAGGSHHSRSKDRQLSCLPASLILIPFPPWRRVGSPRSRTGHQARRSRRRWSPPGSLRRQPQHTTPGSLVPLVPARHRRRSASRWWQIPVALAGPTHGRMVLGGDRCRQPSCRGSPPAPWCHRVSKRVGQQGVGHRRVGCPRYPSRGLFSPGAERRVT